MAVLFKIIWLLILLGGPRNLAHRTNNCKGESKLIFAQVLYRHGNRTISDTYPTDPFQDAKYWPEGFGVLTKAGKKLEYKLGRYLRRRYKQLLAPSHSSDKVYIRSSNENRTIASAQYNSAGLLLPCSKRSRKYYQKNHTIPIHTVPLDEDILLNQIQLPCASADKIRENYLQSDEIQNFLEEYAGLRNYIARNSGSPADTLFQLYVFYDALNIESARGLPLPCWAQTVLRTNNDALEVFDVVNYLSFTHGTLQKKARAGFLIKDIFDRFRDKILGFLDPKLSLYLYSTHDYVLVNVLNSLNVFNLLEPPYASSVHFELHQYRCDYYIQLFYRNDTSEYLPPIEIPNCGKKCPLNRLYDLYEDILPKDNETHESVCRL